MKEILIKSIVIAVVILANVLMKQTHLHYLNIILLLLAFVTTFVYREKFFPYFTSSIALFLMASLQELLNYQEEPVTLVLHIAARTMFAVAVCIEIFKSKS